MAQCGVVTYKGNVTALDNTEYLPVDINTFISLAAVDMSLAEGEEDRPSPFADIPLLAHEDSCLPVRFNGLVDTTLVYITGKG